MNVSEHVILVNNCLKAEDFVRLKVATGFRELPVEQAEKALANGLFNVTAIYNGEIVGMGRLVGDGAMYWYLQEIIILPQYQRQGIGRKIVNHLLEHIRESGMPGTLVSVGGVSVKGKEPFYEKMGFRILSTGINQYLQL